MRGATRVHQKRAVIGFLKENEFLRVGERQKAQATAGGGGDKLPHHRTSTNAQKVGGIPDIAGHGGLGVIQSTEKSPRL